MLGFLGEPHRDGEGKSIKFIETVFKNQKKSKFQKFRKSRKFQNDENFENLDIFENDENVAKVNILGNYNFSSK